MLLRSTVCEKIVMKLSISVNSIYVKFDLGYALLLFQYFYVPKYFFANFIPP